METLYRLNYGNGTTDGCWRSFERACEALRSQEASERRGLVTGNHTGKMFIERGEHPETRAMTDSDWKRVWPA